MSEPEAESREEEVGVLPSVESEIHQLMGLFDAPSFVRRAMDMDHALNRLHGQCARARLSMLDMVHVRLRQWSSVAIGPEDWTDTFETPIDPLWGLSGASWPDRWADRPGPVRRRRIVARELAMSVDRFNGRWSRFLGGLNLEAVNGKIEKFNSYYVIEKECVLGSQRLAARMFQPRERLTIETLLASHPLLPRPAVRD